MAPQSKTEPTPDLKPSERTTKSSLLRSEAGASIFEYALMVAVLSVVSVSFIELIGLKLPQLFEHLGNQLSLILT